MSIVPDSKGLLLGLTIGLIIGVTIGGPFLANAHTSAANTSQPAVSYSSSGPSCNEGSTENAGWVHVVANGKTWAVTMNTTVVHPPGTAVEVDVIERPTGEYELALSTVEATRQKPLSEPDCQVATTIDMATGLSEPNFVISMNGRIIRAVDQEETVANLYQLPNPINASR